MAQNLTSEDVRDKIKSLCEDTDIASKMRTHLRWLIVKKLRGLPRTEQSLSLRARAIGSLIVEWLQQYQCHYTLSVLVSELPGLADLPRLSGTGDTNKFPADEVEELLLALDIKGEEIIQNYSSDDCLLNCFFKSASEWKKRLEFKDLNLVNEEDEQYWGCKLKEISAEFCIQPEKLPFLYSTLNRLVNAKIRDTLKIDRAKISKYEAELKEKFEQQEEKLKQQLIAAEDAFYKNKSKAHEELLKEHEMLTQLSEEVKRQHQIVVENLEILDAKMKKLEAEKKTKLEKLESVRLESVLSSSSSETSLNLSQTRKKVKELKEEVKSARDEYVKNDSQSEEISPAVIIKFRESTQLHEGCHSDYNHFRQSRARYGHLLAQGDDHKPFVISGFRNNTGPKSIQEIRATSNDKKLEYLMKCVRPRTSREEWTLSTNANQLE